MSMPENTEAKTDAPETEAEVVDSEQPAAPAAPSDSGEGLTAGGKAAIQAERDARREADRKAKDLADQLTAAQAAKTQADKQLAEATSRLAQAEADRARFEVAAKTGVPADLLVGSADPQAAADALLAWRGAAAPVATPVPSVGKQPDVKPKSLDEQIAAAEAAGDRGLAARLKAAKLSQR